MHAPTSEGDCWVRYRRGDHWSSACWRKWCWDGGVNQQFVTARGGGRAMHAPTAEDDCWVRYRRGDHWSSASSRKWCWNNDVPKSLPCAKGGAERSEAEGLYLTTAHDNYVQPLSHLRRQLFEPGRRQSLLTLWLKICHWHIFLTRRAPYTGEPFGNGVNQQFATAHGGGRAMHAPTAEDDCWDRHRRGDHWSSACWRK